LYPLTGKITCGICGKYYRRKIANAGTKYEKTVWICSTFNKLGKSACPSQQIPEDIILDIVPTDFSEIRIPANGVIIFVLKDGTEITRNWQNPSRSLSWTDEMKEKARQQTKERRKA
jgi:hypothetical protein